MYKKYQVTFGEKNATCPRVEGDFLATDGTYYVEVVANSLKEARLLACDKFVEEHPHLRGHFNVKSNACILSISTAAPRKKSKKRSKRKPTRQQQLEQQFDMSVKYSKLEDKADEKAA